jgi:serine/alanine adding enzyme
MTIIIFDNYKDLALGEYDENFQNFVCQNPQGNYFQSSDFFELCDGLAHFEAFLILAVDNEKDISGSLLGVIQTTGTGLKSWFSRRLIVWGGPLVTGKHQEKTAQELLAVLKKHAYGKAIFVEFRNLNDLEGWKPVFEAEGFQYQPYLNFLVKTDDEDSVIKRMHGNRRRKIRKSFRTGAEVREASTAEEVHAFYNILEHLYKTRVKKPLPDIALFLKLWRSKAGKIFVVLFNEKVIGGSACPVFDQRIIYDWFRCAERNVTKGIFPGVLAAWAPIEFALRYHYEHLDFMGAGKPDEPYGVRDFKAHFGGEEIAYGRFITVLNRPLFEIGKLGLKVYEKL